MSGSIINRKQSSLKGVTLQIVFLHFAAEATQEGILEEKLGHAWHPIAPAFTVSGILPAYWYGWRPWGPQCVRSQRVPICSLQHCPQQNCYPVLKALKLDIDLASFWAEDLSRHLFPEYGDFIHIELFTLASNFLSQSVYSFQKFFCCLHISNSRLNTHFFILCNEWWFIFESFKLLRTSSIVNVTNKHFALAMIVMMLRNISFCVWSWIQVIRSFSISDIGPFWIFVSLVAVNEADPITASVTLFLFFKIVAMVEWDMPDCPAITITGFSPS